MFSMKRWGRGKGRSLFLVALTLWFSLASAGEAAVYFVNSSKEENGEGISWESALNEAGFIEKLGTAVSGDEFWMAAGTYRPVIPVSVDAITAAEQKSFFKLNEGVSLYGGFSGTESKLEERNPKEHITVLTGDLALDDETDEAGGTLSAEGIKGQNSTPVLKANKATGIRLDGLVVTGGDGSMGAGLTLTAGAEVLAADCLFQGNRAKTFGGAVNAALSSFDVRSSRFLKNQGGPNSHGGALNSVRSNLRLVDTVFEGNKTGSDEAGSKVGNGGAVQFSDKKDDDKTLFIENCSFLSNSAGAGGGALYIQNAYGGVTVLGTSFKNNRASHNGGAARFTTSTNVLIEECLFEGNETVIEGGAIYNSEVGTGGRGMEIRSCTFSGNRTYDDRHITDVNKGSGGAVYNGVSSPVLINCTFFGNEAKYGGALFNRTGSYPLLLNCTFHKNRAVPQEGQGGEGASVYNTGCDAGYCKPGGGRIVAFNCIFQDGEGSEIVNAGDSGAALHHSLLPEGAVSGDKTVLFEVSSEDPKLGALGKRGGRVPTILPGWASPAMDRGWGVGPLTSSDVLSADVFWLDQWLEMGVAIPSQDARDIERPQYEGVDIGAVELSSHEEPISPEEPAPKDAISLNPLDWSLSLGTADEAGLIPVTIRTILRIAGTPFSIRVEGTGFVGVIEVICDLLTSGRDVKAAVNTENSEERDYIVTIKGKTKDVANAAITEVRYKTKEGGAEKKVALPEGGIKLSDMSRTDGSSGGSSGGCDSGFGQLAALAVLALLLRQRRS